MTYAVYMSTTRDNTGNRNKFADDKFPDNCILGNISARRRKLKINNLQSFTLFFERWNKTDGQQEDYFPLPRLLTAISLRYFEELHPVLVTQPKALAAAIAFLVPTDIIAVRLIVETSGDELEVIKLPMCW